MYVYVYICMYVYVYIHIELTPLFISFLSRRCAGLDMYMYVYMYVYVYIYIIYVYIYIGLPHCLFLSFFLGALDRAQEGARPLRQGAGANSIYSCTAYGWIGRQIHREGARGRERERERGRERAGESESE